METETKRTIYSRFKEVVDRQPDALAIAEDGKSVTFKELDTLVNNLAATFYDREEKFIGIVMHHGINQIAAMLAVLKSGPLTSLPKPSFLRTVSTI